VQDVTILATPEIQKSLAVMPTISITAALEYQVCDDKVCYNPARVPFRDQCEETVPRIHTESPQSRLDASPETVHVRRLHIPRDRRPGLCLLRSSPASKCVGDPECAQNEQRGRRENRDVHVASVQ
jgi:hypothetical protein